MSPIRGQHSFAGYSQRLVFWLLVAHCQHQACQSYQGPQHEFHGQTHDIQVDKERNEGRDPESRQNRSPEEEWGRVGVELCTVEEQNASGADHPQDRTLCKGRVPDLELYANPKFEDDPTQHSREQNQYL